MDNSTLVRIGMLLCRLSGVQTFLSLLATATYILEKLRTMEIHQSDLRRIPVFDAIDGENLRWLFVRLAIEVGIVLFLCFKARWLTTKIISTLGNHR